MFFVTLTLALRESVLNVNVFYTNCLLLTVFQTAVVYSAHTLTREDCM